MKNIFFIFVLVFFSLIFGGCTQLQKKDIGTITTLSGIIDRSDFTGSLSTVLFALKNQDFLTLSHFVGPQGIRFSPYQYISTGDDIILHAKEVANGLSLSRSYKRGIYDGSGEPIDLSIGQYFEKFVNDVDYTKAPEIYYNQQIQRGNTINNISQIYSGKQRVEYYFPGFDPQYGGMDRKSLTLVFENVDNQRYLIGIIHGSRTI